MRSLPRWRLSKLSIAELHAALNEKAQANEGVVCGICGLPGSGKTTLGEKLADMFPGRAISINIDDFCNVPTQERKSFLLQALEDNDAGKLVYLARPDDPRDNPYADPVSWYDWEEAAEAVKILKSGHSYTHSGAWDQSTGMCSKSTVYNPPKDMRAPLFFIDCIYLDEAPLSQQIDCSIFLDVSPEVASERERKRDQHRSDISYLHYKRIVSDYYCVPYLERYRKKADFIISSE